MYHLAGNICRLQLLRLSLLYHAQAGYFIIILFMTLAKPQWHWTIFGMATYVWALNHHSACLRVNSHNYSSYTCLHNMYLQFAYRYEINFKGIQVCFQFLSWYEDTTSIRIYGMPQLKDTENYTNWFAPVVMKDDKHAYCTLRERIKNKNSTLYAKKCQVCCIRNTAQWLANTVQLR